MLQGETSSLYAFVGSMQLQRPTVPLARPRDELKSRPARRPKGPKASVPRESWRPRTKANCVKIEAEALCAKSKLMPCICRMCAKRTLDPFRTFPAVHAHVPTGTRLVTW